jgi:hypothetical protein
MTFRRHPARGPPPVSEPRGCSVRVLVTGGIGVLGRATIPLLAHNVTTSTRSAPSKLDLFDPVAVGRAVHDAAGILHLATRIPPRERASEREAWRENDRLRAEASRLLVDATLAAETEVYVQPSITFLYPGGGTGRRGDAAWSRARASALCARGRGGARFAAAGRRGVVLRLRRSPSTRSPQAQALLVSRGGESQLSGSALTGSGVSARRGRALRRRGVRRR